ncbi:MAG: mycofactocin biosynthesis glycosyltransferase MftF [Firmicutes bacterium]|nr:mycofactocin biosynthesis glycosyltransferase MftF [Bacillota bacterium]
MAAKGYLTLNYEHCGGRISADEFPRVTVVIPVKNRPREIRECLYSLSLLDYPEEKLEIIVVNDGSTDDTGEAISLFNVRSINLLASKGQSRCRNIGAREATGEIIAFLDSDCTVTPGWLKQIVPFFAFPGIGAVGGFVGSYYKASRLDRYEKAFSSLNMGNHILFEANPESNFYVPSCNLFVRRDVFLKTGGFKEGMHVGEDVDFCWRMRNAGYYLLYVPAGAVAHKHRNTLPKMLKRRMEYGISEADLYLHHVEKKKQFPIPVYAGLSFIVFFLAIILRVPALLFLNLFICGAEYCKKRGSLSGILSEIYRKPVDKLLLRSVVRGTVSFYYYASFYLIRYYLAAIVLLGLAFPPLLLFSVVIVFISSAVDYKVKKPALSYPVFLFYYILDHLAYQFGVFQGCLKHKYFKCYIPNIKLASFRGIFL